MLVSQPSEDVDETIKINPILNSMSQVGFDTWIKGSVTYPLKTLLDQYQ